MIPNDMIQRLRTVGKERLFFFISHILYNLVLSMWILPSRAITTSLTQKYHMSTYLTEFKVGQNSNLLGKTLNDFKTKKNLEYDIIKIIRNKVDLTIGLRDAILLEGDILLLQINLNDILTFKKEYDWATISVVFDKPVTEIINIQNTKIIKSNFIWFTLSIASSAF